MTQSHALPQALSCTENSTQGSGLFMRIAGYVALAKSRRALAGLGPDELADIGLSAAEAHQEARRPFWDAAPHWTK